VILVIGSAVAVAMAASALARQLWPFRRSVNMLLAGQFILGAVALGLTATGTGHMRLTIACLAGAGLCLGGQIVGGLRARFGRWQGWRALLRGRRPTSQVHVWTDALGAGLVGAALPWADGHQMAMSVMAFAFTGVGPGLVQSIRVYNRRYE
jgi:hypothetical protein